MYGLRGAPRYLQEHFLEVIHGMFFSRLFSDSVLVVKNKLFVLVRNIPVTRHVIPKLQDIFVLKHLTWLDGTGVRATFVGSKIVRTDIGCEVFESSQYIMNMAAALDLIDAKNHEYAQAPEKPGTLVVSECVGRDTHAVFSSVVGMLFWLSF